MGGEIERNMYSKLKAWLTRAFYAFMTISIAFVLFKSGAVYIKYDNMAVTFGVNLGEDDSQEALISKAREDGILESLEGEVIEIK